jgi:hypothetical protein
MTSDAHAISTPLSVTRYLYQFRFTFRTSIANEVMQSGAPLLVPYKLTMPICLN